MLPSSIANGLGPNAVADWQAAHGLTPDGEIGPKTADAMHVEAEARGVKLHFDAAEIMQGNAVPKGWEPRLRRTLRMCEVRRRDVFGGVPCVVCTAGGFRKPNQHRAPGQADKSQHKELTAADLKPVVPGTGTPAKDWAARTLAMMQDGRLEPGGFHVYHANGLNDKGEVAEPFCHTDWRGYIAQWS